GTLLADALLALPATTMIVDSEGDNYTVDLTWDIPGYNGEVAGDYTAVGTFDLPAGVENCDNLLLEVTCTVTVLEEVFPSLVNVEPVESITVPFGTIEAEALALLAETTNIEDSEGTVYVVTLDWAIEDYNGDVAGIYDATGSFELPEGVVNDLELDLFVTATVTVEEAELVFLELPYCNEFRTDDDFDQAVEDGFGLEDVEQRTAAGGYLLFNSVGAFVETPNIDFTDYEEIIVTFATATFGGSGGQTLALQISADNGATWETLYTTTPTETSPYDENEVIIDLTGAYNVADGKLRFFFIEGANSIRFRDMCIEPYVEPVFFTLTVNIEGEGDVFVNDELYTETLTVLEGTELNLLAVAAVQWEFVGWTGDLVSDIAAETLLMDGDKVVTATFEEIPPEEYTLTINIAGDGDVFVDGVLYTEPITVIEGTELALLADPADGWAFIDWTGDLVSDEAALNLLMDGDKNITATFEFVPTEFTLTINIVGQGTVEVDGVEYAEPLIIDAGDVVQLEALAADDWMFDGWSGDLVSDNPLESVQMDSDKTITARFTGLQVEVTITDVSCFAGDDGEIFVSITGGVKPYNIALYAGCDRLAPPMKSDVKTQTVHYTGLISMNYYLSIVDANGVIWTGCLEVGEPDPLTVEIETEPVLCFGDPGTGLAKVTVSGGTPPYSIEFLGETYILNDNEAPYNITFEDLDAGVYEIIVNDANDCGPDVYTFEILDPEPIVADVVYDPIECFGETTFVDVIASGGTGDLALYDVVNGELVFVSELPLAAPIELPAGEYLWAVVDENECVEFLEFEIEQPEEIVPWVEYDHILCFGETTEVFVNAMGGTGALTLYDVIDGDLVEVGLLPLTLELGAGEYTWAVMDENGCVVPLDFEIVQPDELIVDIVTFPVSELGGQDGEIHVTMSGGVGPYNIFLYTTCDIDDKDAESFDKSQGAIYTGLPAGEYMIVVIDQNGCTYMECVEVEVDMGKDPLSDDYLNLKEATIVAYPNPFRDETVIEFVLVESSYVTLEVYNMIGEKVTVLFQGQVDAFEPYTVNMRAGDLPNGVYFYRLNTGKGTYMNKLILAR
ncbi:MAG: T9SS C-terminal target domain-containing protein, partial [Bacteroidetes bacterium]